MTPSVAALPSVEMTPDTLWAVWSRAPGFLRAANPARGSVRLAWMLASPGPAGLEEISSPNGFPDSLIAALPLTAIRQVSEMAGGMGSPAGAPSWVGSLLGWAERLVLLRLADGKAVFFSASDQRPEGATLLMEGSRLDLDQVLASGEKILESLDYNAVLDDMRPITENHPEGWLYQRRNPAAYAALQQFMEEHGQNS